MRRSSRSGSSVRSWAIGRLPRFAEELAEPLYPAEQQADGGWARAADPLGHFGHGKLVQVAQLNDAPLVLRQTGEGLGQPQQLFAADGPPARGGLVGRQQVFQPGRGALELGLQGSLPAGVAHLRIEPSARRRKRVGQDSAKPCQPLAFGSAPELVPSFVGLEYRLLDDVGGVELRARRGPI